MRNKKILLFIIVGVLTATTVGVSLAFMFEKVSVNNKFKAATVSCKVHEMLDGKEITEGINYGNQKHSIKVENTGDIKSYIRVKIVSYWVNADGIVVGLPSANVNIEPKSGWIKGDNDIYYYTSAIEPSAFTGILSSPIDLKVSLDANGNTVYQAIDILSEAIQAEPTLAAEEAWGITIDENGMIR